MRTRFGSLALCAGVLGVCVSSANARTVHDGIVFEAGDVSFADVILSYTPGTPVPTAETFMDANSALGAPDYSDVTGAVSLGSGGMLLVEFTDNALVADQTDAADLFVFETGTSFESVFVDISQNGVSYLRAGQMTSSTDGVDIDAIVNAAGLDIETEFKFVRITDNPSQGSNSNSTPGADIDAIGAISSTGKHMTFTDPDTPVVDPSVVPVPAPALLLLGAVMGLGAFGKRRKS